MVSTGIPEFRSLADLDYLKWALNVNATEEEAERWMESQIQLCLDRSWTTQINWWCHNVKHM